MVPLWLPVALLELLFVFAGDEAVGTRCPPYCKQQRHNIISGTKELDIIAQEFNAKIHVEYFNTRFNRKIQYKTTEI